MAGDDEDGQDDPLPRCQGESDITALERGDGGGGEVLEAGLVTDSFPSSTEALLPRGERLANDATRTPFARRESATFGGWLKALLMSFFVAYPYYAVVNELEYLDTSSFTPCNDHPCHYMKLFYSGGIPGTGSDIIQVQNGYYRPLKMRDKCFTPRTQSFRNTTTDEDMKHFLNVHPDLSGLLQNETAAVERTQWPRKIAFWMTKVPMKIVIQPFTFVARQFPSAFGEWGMEHVVPGRCKHKSADEMRNLCSSEDMKARIQNGLATAKSRWAYIVGLFSWAFFRSVHDVLLMLGVRESVTLFIRQAALFFQGVATFAIFFWSSGGSAVFGAFVPDTEEPCMCYYQLSLTAAFFALVTPFSLLVLYIGSCQMAGMAALYGDFLYCQAYTMPFYLVRQSKMWSWSTLVVPWVAGTPNSSGEASLANRDQNLVEGRDGSLSREFFKSYRRAQQMQVVFRDIVFWIPVALASGPAILRAEELATLVARCEKHEHFEGETNNQHDAHSQHFMLKAVMLVPSVFTLIYGVFVSREYSEHFIELHEEVQPKLWSGLKACCTRRVFLTFVGTPFAICVLAMSLAVAEGLFPDMDYVLPWRNTPPPPTSLVQAELWGACGFMFVVVPVQLLLTTVYSTHEDLMKLLNLGHPEKTPTKSEGEAPESYTREPAEDQDIDGMKNVIDEYGTTYFYRTRKYNRNYVETQ